VAGASKGPPAGRLRMLDPDPPFDESDRGNTDPALSAAEARAYMRSSARRPENQPSTYRDAPAPAPQPSPSPRSPSPRRGGRRSFAQRPIGRRPSSRPTSPRLTNPLGGRSPVEVAHSASGLLLGAVAYALILSVVNYGPTGPLLWFRAKFLNIAAGSSSSSSAPTPDTAVPPKGTLGAGPSLKGIP